MKKTPYIFVSRKLSRAGQYLQERLEERGEPVITPFEFFHLVWRMYRQADQKLYLRGDTPGREEYTHLRANLRGAGVIRSDPDYGKRIIRIPSVADKPTESIVCLVDPTVYISHLSAMQRWGLTERDPLELMLTRPEPTTAATQRQEYMARALDEGENNPLPLGAISHPTKVRTRPLHIHQSKVAGAWIRSRNDGIRLSTIGQTFLDMLQKPELCGGMSHVIEVWEEYAETYLDEIIQAVDTASSKLVKSRAGYILEERLSLSHPAIEAWKALGQRGGSRKLDPTRNFAPTYSETWMISLNV